MKTNEKEDTIDSSHDYTYQFYHLSKIKWKKNSAHATAKMTTITTTETILNEH